MLKQSLQQKFFQKLSPRQIQLMKLIQIPTLDMEVRIKEELEANPALEIDDEYDVSHDDEFSSDSNEIDSLNNKEDSNSDDYDNYSENDYDNYNDHYYDHNADDENEDVGQPIKAQISFYELLMQQLDLLDLNDEDKKIAVHIIGSIDDDGYLRRTAEDISDDLAFKEGLNIDSKHIRSIIEMIQTFEPSGVAAFDLQECLLIQLNNLEEETSVTKLAKKIISNSFQSFTKKHYLKIQEKYKLSDDQLKNVIDLILKLSPRPGFSYQDNDHSNPTAYIYPDFFITNEYDKIIVSLNDKNIPHLRVTPDFQHMMEDMNGIKNKSQSEKEAEVFIKQNIDAANWFIEAIQQRKETLITTMNAIVDKQRDFFLSGNPLDLKPMILKDIAEVVNLDISTVSRVSRSKYVQTQFGIFPLKYFFTDSFTNDEGEDISIVNVKNALKELIDNEDKKKPLSDIKLTEVMIKKGYNVARRTITKYRDQLNIPVAQLRKELK